MTTYLQDEIELDDKPLNTDVKVCYNQASHPDMLTEQELEAVTTVFRSFESGLREATIYPSVSSLKLLNEDMIWYRIFTRQCACWGSTQQNRRSWTFLMRLQGEKKGIRLGLSWAKISPNCYCGA